MRILHVIPSDAFGGVERHVGDLAAAQQRAGHSVCVVGGPSDQMRRALEREASDRAPHVGHVPATTLLDAVRAIAASPRPDVVNAHMTAAEAAAVASPALRSVALVSTRHFAARRGSRLVARRFGPAVARRLDAQIAVSQYVADSIEGDSSVVRAGVPVAPDARPASERERVVLVAQRLEREKRTQHALLAFAFSGLWREGWSLQVAGDGAERRRLEHLAEDLSLAHSISFLGHRSDIAALMERAAILMAPAAIDAYGLSVVEAMASGLPVVAAAGGGHLETLGSVADSALFPPGDAREAGRMLHDLAHDAAARDAYGRAIQRAQRERFTLEMQQQATEDVYRSVL
jgi:glycosyltransferase involved in cell wall biosynthesis